MRFILFPLLIIYSAIIGLSQTNLTSGISETGNVWIVAVNVYQYQNAGILSPLDYSSSGAYEFAQLYDSRQLTMSSPEILVNRRATRESIIEALNANFVANPALTREDLIIFYFSGHGGTAGTEIGICPYDYSGDIRDLITDSEIITLMDRSIAKHKICFLEACKSKIVSQEIYNTSILNSFNERRKNIRDGLVFITSSEAGKETYGLAGESGYFTKYLLKGLEGECDQNQDKIVTIQELFSFIQLGVKADSKGNQLPQINASGFDPLMPVIIIPNIQISMNTPTSSLPPTVPKRPCETTGTGELCIINNSGEERWTRINDKVTPLPMGIEECFVNLKAGFLKYRVTNYEPGGGSYSLGGAYDYEVEIRQCETVKKTLR